MTISISRIPRQVTLRSRASDRRRNQIEGLGFLDYLQKYSLDTPHDCKRRTSFYFPTVVAKEETINSRRPEANANAIPNLNIPNPRKLNKTDDNRPRHQLSIQFEIAAEATASPIPAAGFQTQPAISLVTDDRDINDGEISANCWAEAPSGSGLAGSCRPGSRLLGILPLPIAARPDLSVGTPSLHHDWLAMTSSSLIRCETRAWRYPWP